MLGKNYVVLLRINFYSAFIFSNEKISYNILNLEN